MTLGKIDYSIEPKDLKLFLNKPDLNRTTVARLNHSYSERLLVKLNQLNELNFSFPIEIDVKNQLQRDKDVDKIKKHYLIRSELGDEIEYFIIDDVKKSSDNVDELQVTAYSLGYELSFKLIRGYSVTSYNCTQVLTDALEGTKWTVGYINPNFDNTYRSFKESGTSSLDLVFKTAKTFDGIVDFDTINRAVNIYSKDEIGENKGLHVRYGHYLQSLNEESNTDEFATRLKVYGKGDLSIQKVNPSGQTYIEDYSYYKNDDYMSSGLQTSLDNYNSLLNSKKPIEEITEVGTNETNITITSHGLSDGDYIVNRSRRELVGENYVHPTREIVVVDTNNITILNAEKGSIVDEATGQLLDSDSYIVSKESLDKDYQYEDVVVEKSTDNSTWSLATENSDYTFDYDSGLLTNISGDSLYFRLDYTYHKNIIKGQTDGDLLDLYSTGTFGKLLFEKEDLEEDRAIKEIEKFNLETEKTIVLDTIYIQKETDTYTEYDFTYNGSTTTKTTTLESTKNYAVMTKVSDATDLTVKLDGTDISMTPNTWKVLGKKSAVTSTSVEVSGAATNVNVRIEVVEITQTEYDVTGNEADIIDKYNVNYKESQISNKQSEIDSVQTSINNKQTEIDNLRNELSKENNFTASELEELKQFTIEREWIDQNYENEKDLYNAALEKLKEINTPQILLNISIINLLEIVEEQRNWDKLVLGDYITVKHDKLKIDFNVQLVEIEYSFEDGNINLKISNLKESKSPQERYLDSLDRSIDTYDELQKNKHDWDNIGLNFNSRNDRISVKPDNPTVTSDGTAIDHVANTDGSVDISFEWAFNPDNSTDDKYKIDGFIVYVFSDNKSQVYTFGSKIAKEQVSTVSSTRRSFALYGVPSNRYFTFGVQAYRNVDDDINFEGILKSDIIKSEYSTENPYLPHANVSFNGDIQGTIGGTPYNKINKTPDVIIGVEDSSKDINRADYVVPSGSVNAETVIQEAINSLTNGGRLFLMEGTYTISNTITIPSSVTIEGKGNSTEIVLNTNQSINQIITNTDTVNGNKHIIIKNLLLNGNKANGAATNGITFDNVLEAKINGISVVNCSKSGIILNNSTDAVVTMSTIADNDSNGLIFDMSSNNKASLNKVSSNGNVGIYLYATDPSYISNDNIISNNHVSQNGGDGIVATGDNGKVYFNNISNNTVNSNVGFGVSVYANENMGVLNNTCNYNGKSGVRIVDSSNCKVSNNTCEENKEHGIYIYGIFGSSNNNDITDNKCKSNSQASDNTYSNIAIGYGDYNNIQNNICRVGSLLNKPKYGVVVESVDCDANVITNNDLYNSGFSGNLSDSGTGTVTTAGNRL